MKMFIGGSAVNASDGAEIDVINPATKLPFRQALIIPAVKDCVLALR